ncbi:MAG: hypothetical protein HYV63_24910 [Candidatus Schekmanbacteria bacterium]|nr:hypothetical protein [Candidatus Schekmanbacteria bacterium]
MAETAVCQLFPVRRGGALVHQTWAVDEPAALRFHPMGPDGGARLRRELEEMQRHLPRWVLTVSEDLRRIPCPSCDSTLVFSHGLRCVACEKEPGRRVPTGRATLAWFGLLPPIGVDTLSELRDSLLVSPPQLHPVGRAEGIGSYLLVPLVASYPPGFPSRPVAVSYLPTFFTIRGMPPAKPSHVCHLLSDGQMCLFAANDWREEMTCRQVIEQRAYAHVIKLLNFANGKKNAFAIVS